MAKRIEGLSKKDIINAFPNLSTDPDFEITSPATPLYNCIAWAYGLNDKWMQPNTGDSIEQGLDALFFWPDEVENDCDISFLIEVFALKGFVVCDSWEHEEGFRKIALYVEDDTTNYTHAARELVGDKKTCGKWTSKLGKANDIQHMSPYSIEGDAYGVVHCIMRRPFP